MTDPYSTGPTPEDQAARRRAFAAGGAERSGQDPEMPGLEVFNSLTKIAVTVSIPSNRSEDDSPRRFAAKTFTAVTSTTTSNHQHAAMQTLAYLTGEVTHWLDTDAYFAPDKDNKESTVAVTFVATIGHEDDDPESRTDADNFHGSMTVQGRARTAVDHLYQHMYREVQDWIAAVLPGEDARR